MSAAARTRLPQNRRGITHAFNVGGVKGIIIINVYDSGLPGEMFISIAKAGSTLSGLMDSFAILCSIAFQYGVPLEVISAKMVGTQFEPNGWTQNQDIKHAKSLMDYIFRWMDVKFGGKEIKQQSLPNTVPPNNVPVEILISSDAPACHLCGMLTQPNGSCYVCSSCGSTTGCS